MKGVFTISLDFELHWGVFDKRPRDGRMNCYANTRKLIPQLLELFEKHQVHVTWATVGSLFAENAEQWKRFVPQLKPSYANAKVSAYNFAELEDITAYEEAYFAYDLVRDILNYEGQELATHTFSHYYCLEDGQKPEEFDADLKAAQAAAETLDVQLRSLVFPRNQFNNEYLKICWDNGIQTVRSNPSNWYWTGVADENTSLLRKVFRTGDTYIPLGKKTYSLQDIKRQIDQPLLLPASRLLRSHNPKLPVANKLRMQRILSEMEYAAKNNECYHLWWHPENFGDHPQQNIEDLQKILSHFSSLQKKYDFQSWNMAEYWKYLPA
jgi:peptidoglycan/xylan/chitin deacetylase (PgdA/CDA1 family)